MDELIMPTTKTANMFFPITRIDHEKREVIGRATVEDLDNPDSYGTVFSYEGSKTAFNKWQALGIPLREMHDPKKAVGRGVEWLPIPGTKEIEVRSRVSTGAEDTWQKCLDGTLVGYSVGANNGKWGTVERNGKKIPFLESYDLVELSLVDNPSAPGCNIQIVRNDGTVTEVLDMTDPSEEVVAEVIERAATPEPEPVERAGARVSHVTQDALHGMRDNQLRSALSTMQLCGCDECNAGVLALDPDNDGDIDIIPSLDYDSDGGKSDSMSDYRAMEATITRLLSPAIQRVNLLSAQVAAQKQPTPTTIDTSAIERRFEAVESLLSGLVEVRSLLSEVKEQAVSSNALIERIAAQPQQGGPFANGAAMEKLLATQGHTAAHSMSNAEFVQRAQGLGLLNNDNKQVIGASMQIADIINRP